MSDKMATRVDLIRLEDKITKKIKEITAKPRVNVQILESEIKYIFWLFVLNVLGISLFIGYKLIELLVH